MHIYRLDITLLLNQPHIRKTLGVDEQVVLESNGEPDITTENISHHSLE